MKRLTAALLLSVLGCLHAGEWRVALIPPQDNSQSRELVRAVAQRVGLPVDVVSPEDFVNPETFNATRYPLAVFTGHERYCYTVKETGDGAKALLRYLHNGGTLFVAGICWPFYRPYDWDGREWQRSSGKLPEFAGKADDYLAKQMQRFNQNADSSFNRQLGLNISGDGTKQFEKPEEPVTFVRLPNADLRWSGDVPYPLPGGDMRFRPVSTALPAMDLKIEPLVTLKGESGTNYGPAFAFVTRPGAAGKTGVVAYVAEPLLRTPRGEDVVFTVLARTAKKNGFTQQTNAVTDLQSRLTQARQTIAALPAASPVRELLSREAGLIADGLGSCRDAATVGNLALADQLAKAIEDRLATQEQRLGAK
jgi:hypothetical protein